MAMHTTLWSDEMTALFFVSRGSFGSIENLKPFFWDNTPPLYYFLLKIWAGLSHSTLFLRMLSLVFTLLCGAVVHRIGRRFFSPSVAAWAVFFFVTSSLALYYSIELRAYALFELTGAVNLYFFLDANDQAGREHRREFGERRAFTPAYAASAAAFLFTHYFAWIPVSCQVLFLLFDKRSKHQLFIAMLLLEAGAIAVIRIHPIYLIFLARPIGPALALYPYELLKSVCCESNTLLVLLALALYAVSGRAKRVDDLILWSGASTVALGVITGLDVAKAKYFLFLIPYVSLVLAICAARLEWKCAGAFAFAIAGFNLWSTSFTLLKDRGGWAEAGARVPSREDSLVVMIGREGLKRPYFAEHRTQIFRSGEAKEFERAFSHDAQVWLLYSRDIEVHAQSAFEFESVIERRGCPRSAQGVFGEKTSEPVAFIRFDCDRKGKVAWAK